MPTLKLYQHTVLFLLFLILAIAVFARERKQGIFMSQKTIEIQSAPANGS